MTRPLMDLAKALSYALHLHRSGNLAGAEQVYRDLRKAAPDHPEVTYNFAVLLGQTGRPTEAVSVLRRLVRQHPGYAAAHATLGVFLRDLGQRGDAVASLEKARGLRPTHAPTLVNLGNAYVSVGQEDAATATYHAALALDPTLPQPRRALADLYLAAKDPSAARRVMRAQLACWPEDAGAWRLLGMVHASEHDRAGALAAYERARRLDPHAEATSHAVRRILIPMVPDSVEDARAAETAYERILSDLAAHYAVAPPEALAAAAIEAASPETFLLAYSTSDVTGVLTQHGDMMARLCEARYGQMVPRIGRRMRRDGRLRVAIVSQHIRHRHPIWKGLIRGWVAGLDRKRFSVIGIHTGDGDDADVRTARSAFDAVIGRQATMEDYIRAIAKQTPDVLIYPDGPLGTIGHQLSALRLAPVQCATWGHPATTGLPTVDAFLSADAMEPADGQTHYRERLLRVANLGTAYAPDTEGVPAHDRSWFGEEPDVALFACIGSLYKYRPEHDDLFPRIADQAGPCRFIFFDDFVPALTRRFQARLAAAFAAHGMDWTRFCRFLPRTTPTEFYKILGAFDVYLDAPGFSGFNTAMEALSYNVPVVTHAGHFLRGRLAAGILSHIGMADLVAADLDGYVATAASLARDRALRGEVAARVSAAKAAAWHDSAAVASLQDHLLMLTT